jgi:anthranilate phosphoribosyltransferase
VVHGRDGLDELTVFAKSHVAEVVDGRITEFEVDPAELGLAHTDREGVAGGDAASNAAKVRAILAGEPGAGRDVVVLNSGAALVVAGVVPDLRTGVLRATEALDGGLAREKLAALAAFRP